MFLKLQLQIPTQYVYNVSITCPIGPDRLLNLILMLMTFLSYLHYTKAILEGDFFVKLYFEIAVDQQTRARDQTFEGVPDSGCHWCPRDSYAHICSIFGPILPNHLNLLKNMIWGALIVATNLLNTCI